MKCASCDSENVIKTGNKKAYVCTDCGVTVTVTPAGEHIFSDEIIDKIAGRAAGMVAEKLKKAAEPPTPAPPTPAPKRKPNSEPAEADF